MEIKEILESLQSEKDLIRKIGEKELSHLLKEYPEKFLKSLIYFFLNETNKPESRGLAGLIFKNNLFRSNPRLMFPENYLIPEKKTIKKILEELKGELIKKVHMNNKLLGRIYSQIMAKILFFEFLMDSRNDPFNLVKKIIETNEKCLDIAFMVLQIIESLYHEVLENKTLLKKNKIKFPVNLELNIMSYHSDYCKEPKYKLKVFQVLNNAIEFALDDLILKEKRDYVMNILVKEIYSSDDSVRKVNFEILEKMFVVFYDKIENFMSGVFNLILTQVEIVSEPLRKEMVELCTTLSDKEYNINLQQIEALTEGRLPNLYSKQFIGQLNPILTPTILKLIKKEYIEKDNDDFQYNSPSLTCLNLMSQAAPLSVIPFILNFLDYTLSREKDETRSTICVVVFVAIFDGIGSKILYDKALKVNLLWGSSLGKNHSLLDKDLIWGLEKMLRISSVFSRDYLDKILQSLDHLLFSQHLHKRSFYLLCEIFKSFGEEGLLDWVIQHIITKFLKMIVGNFKIHYSVSTLFDVISSIFINLSLRTKTIIINLIPVLLTQKQILLGRCDFSPDKNQTLIQLGSLRVIASALLNANKKKSSLFVKVCLESLLPLLSSFEDPSHHPCLEEELIVTIGIVAQRFKKLFMENIYQFSFFLNSCAQNFFNFDTCSLAISVVSDIIRDGNKVIFNYFSSLFEFLINILRKEDVHLKIMSSSLICLGDLMISSGISDENQLKDIIFLTKTIINKIIVDNSVSDIDVLEDSIRMKTSLLECWTGIIQNLFSISCQNGNQTNNYNFLWVVKFLENCISDQKIDSIVFSCIGLIGDLVGIDKPLQMLIKKKCWLRQLIIECNSNLDQKLRILGNWSSQSVN